MSKPLAFHGFYADFKIVKTRQVVQIILEIPLASGKAFIDVFGMPDPAAEVPVAIARMETAAEQAKARATAPPATAKVRQSWGELPPSQQAAIRCGEPDFQKWIGRPSPERAAEWVRGACNVSSRSELNTNNIAAVRWHAIDADFYMHIHGARGYEAPADLGRVA